MTRDEPPEPAWRWRTARRRICPMFDKSAHLYDIVHASLVDHAAFADRLQALVQRRAGTTGGTLLDAACGTGAHLPHLRRHYAVEGLDLDPGMLAVARERNPGVPFHLADLVDFDLGRRFDVVLCLGSSIGYVGSVARLRQAVANLARHCEVGGVLVVEPWFAPDVWEVGRITADLADQPNLKVARMLVSGGAGTRSTLDIHYLVASPEGVNCFAERHELGLFTAEEYDAAFERAGVEARLLAEGPLGRGRYVGVRR